MIVHPRRGLKESDPEFQQILDTARKHGLNPDVHRERGKNAWLIQIYIKDGECRASSVPDHVFASLDGVDSVQRVSVSRVSPLSNGKGPHRVYIAPGLRVGANKPTLLVSGECTIDTHIYRVVEKLAELGIVDQRGCGFKPRSSADSFRGPGLAGIKKFLEAAKANSLRSVWTEVIESCDVDAVLRLRDEVGFEGGIVLWVGARNIGNYRLLEALGAKKTEYTVMIKHGLHTRDIDQFMNVASFVLAGPMHWDENGVLDEESSRPSGNDRLILCVRGLEKRDPHDRHRYYPNLSWIHELRQHSWAPVCLDPSHMAGRLDLVFQDLQRGLEYNPDVVMIESHVDPALALCDKDQAVPLDRMAEVVEAVRVHNEKHRQPHSIHDETHVCS